VNVELREERISDYSETENLTREAFWDVYKPGCDEHLVLHQLRQSKAFIPELDYVACDNGRIVGNIVYTKAVVKSSNNESEVLCMGPLCVSLLSQKKGIGSLLLQSTIKIAKSLGYAAVIIFGNPDYYHRFGFKDAKEYNIQTAEGQNFDAFMALDLSDDGLRNVKGKFFMDEAFRVDEENLEKFELNFPYKEKHIKEGQLK
jgi:predicted N-acetyltransferase YhbS